MRRLAGAFPLTAYLGPIVLLTAAVTARVSCGGRRGSGSGRWALVVVGLLLVIGASQLAVAVVHWAAMLLVRPRILPRMDFADGSRPSTARSSPCRRCSPTRGIDELLEALEVRFLANRDENLSFALLSDFRDAPQETTPSDADLLERAQARHRALNAKYGGHERPT